MTATVLAAVEAALDLQGEPDDVLRATVAALVGEAEASWAGIALLEDGMLVLGPQAGTPDEDRRTRVSIAFEGDEVGELLVDGDVEPGVLETIAALIAPHVLIGWDTRGEPWEP